MISVADADVNTHNSDALLHCFCKIEKQNNHHHWQHHLYVMYIVEFHHERNDRRWKFSIILFIVEHKAFSPQSSMMIITTIATITKFSFHTHTKKNVLFRHKNQLFHHQKNIYIYKQYIDGFLPISFSFNGWN